ncbi:hypothetical protein JHFBIEKO_4327 [Methylobacterium mesophilicum]|uniref:hypothetical protein n=1 Tax=Methylobacterium mesophilicum TaxID=39956 RepID=UPI001EE15F00|nr:hypothetical protein [Methylobacterium mesophilicum]GJE23863.1 hypothetical protein JHFBIEKO_4327 [Methylobacterium mesophilicum]
MTAVSKFSFSLLCVLASSAGAIAETPSFIVGDWIDSAGHRISFHIDGNVVRDGVDPGKFSHSSEGGGNFALSFGESRCVYLVSRLSDGNITFGLRRSVPPKATCFYGKLERESAYYSKPNAKDPEIGSSGTNGSSAVKSEQKLKPAKFSVQVLETLVVSKDEHNLSGSTTFLCAGQNVDIKMIVKFKDVKSVREGEYLAQHELMKQLGLLGINTEAFSLE